ncbi:MAG: EAL domain-containing protein [Acidobacteriota bacterium]
MKASNWYLESRLDDRGKVRRTAVRPLPFRVGRQIESDLFLNSSHGSHRHAELFLRGGELWVRDLGSTNGTSVNGDRLTADRSLADGDIIHFADCELRLVEQPPDSTLQTTQVFTLLERKRLEAQVRAPSAFRELLDRRDLRTEFQPVVRLTDNTVTGYELLGRAEIGDTTATPAELFYIAEKLGDEVALSETFRAVGLELAAGLPDPPPTQEPALFMNTHPAELSDPAALLSSVRALRREHPELHLVLEIHEASVANLSSLRALRAGLEELQIDLAFDDFGTGQARLLELTEINPKYLKFDAAWIEKLHLASERRQEMVTSLLRMVADLDITPIAECVESDEEAQACHRLGFEFAQGNFFGPPVPATAC